MAALISQAHTVGLYNMETHLGVREHPDLATYKPKE